MTPDDAPRGRHAVIVAALVTGQTRAQVAEVVGCSEATVTRTRARWRDLIDAQREAVAEETAAAMLALAPRAVARLGASSTHPPPPSPCRPRATSPTRPYGGGRP